MRKNHKIREEIKRLSSLQVEYKLQRKTVHITVPRTITVSHAVSSLEVNRRKLMHLFIALSYLRNGSINENLLPKKKEWSKLIVDGLVDMYSEKKVA